MAILSGIDISHWNEALVKSAGYKWLATFDFVIMKATEGVNFTDKYLSTYINMLYQGKTNPLYGFYHYARPETGTSAESEAKHFLNTIGSHVGLAMFILDVEGEALKVKDLDTWVYKWAKTVYDITGVKPLIYCSESTCEKFKKACEFGCGLWCAKWSENKPKNIKPWTFFALWQNAVKKVHGHNLDFDIFNGTETQFRKYCEVVKDVSYNE